MAKYRSRTLRVTACNVVTVSVISRVRRNVFGRSARNDVSSGSSVPLKGVVVGTKISEAYLEAVKANFKDSWPGRTGRIRRSKIIQKTSKIRYKRLYESIVKRIKTTAGSLRLKPPGNLRPRMRDVYPTRSTVGRLPSIRYSPYARVPGVQEMNTWEYMEPLWGSAQRIILMLRVWFRRAIRNAGTRPPLPNRLPNRLLRLTYNPALD